MHAHSAGIDLYKIYSPSVGVRVMTIKQKGLVGLSWGTLTHAVGPTRCGLADRCYPKGACGCGNLDERSCASMPASCSWCPSIDTAEGCAPVRPPNPPHRVGYACLAASCTAGAEYVAVCKAHAARYAVHGMCCIVWCLHVACRAVHVGCALRALRPIAVLAAAQTGPPPD